MLLASLDDPSNSSSLMLQTIENKKNIYAPWSRSHFSKRLATFWSFPYHNIDSPLNAVAWAKRGWQCIGQTIIQCELCQRQIDLKIEEKDESLHLKVLETIAMQIEIAHADHCCWRKKSCDGMIMKLPLSDGRMSVEAFMERIKKLNELKGGIPEKLELPEGIREDLVKTREERLSMFGWSGLNLNGVLLLVCTACHRRIGEWHFELQKETKFNVIFEHRNYCPWVNSSSQASEEPGWKILYKWLLHLSKSNTFDTNDSLNLRLDRLRTLLDLKKS